jgi:glucose-6-phosphate isomerase
MTESESWARLRALAARPQARAIRPLFADPQRTARHMLAVGGIRADLSKTPVGDDVLAALLDVARDADIDGFRRALFGGAAVNATEGRAVLHMALRAPADAAFRAGAEDASAGVHAVLRAMQDFVARVHGGEVRGATGQPFDTVLNIGIGGSDLGPRMVTEALTHQGGARMRARFLSNVDGHAWAALAPALDPARTLVVVASKTFTTAETMANAAAVRAWLSAALGEAAVAAQFAAVSTNLPACATFGIAPDRVFGFRDWVGGRYSLWSPIGLPIALAAGWHAFRALLDGAWAMDRHARDAGLADNLPLRMALTELWHSLLGATSRAVLPYDDRLRRLPAFLQQLEMESNGKSVRLDGSAVGGLPCPVVFGEPGTDAQHSFMQLVHQGPAMIPVDFILAREPAHDRPDAHRLLAANAIAQAEALLAGRSAAAAAAEMVAAGMDPARAAALAPHRAFGGDRPSIFLLLDRLDAATLGALLALYEHKVAFAGRLWGINSFDQWGVELGKALAGPVAAALAGAAPGAHDPSTAALIAALRGS